MLVQNPLRWTGGCKVMLLLAFVYCMDDNINQLNDVKYVHIIIIVYYLFHCNLSA